MKKFSWQALTFLSQRSSAGIVRRRYGGGMGHGGSRWRSDRSDVSHAAVSSAISAFTARLDAFADRVSGGADAQKRQHLRRYGFGKIVVVHHDQEKTGGDHKGEDKQLKAGHAGAARPMLIGSALFFQDPADIDLTAGDSRQNHEPEQEGDHEAAIFDRQAHFFVWFAGDKDGNHKCR